MRILLIFFILLISSCGVILDPLRIDGTWNLTEVEFYVYNPTLDSIKTLRSKNAENPDDDRPVISEYFGLDGSGTYTITFDSNNKSFSVQRKGNKENSRTDDDELFTVVDDPFGSWSVNAFENSLSLSVTGDTTDDVKLWKKGFELNNFWPMSDYQTLEILVQDGGSVGPLYVDLKKDTIRILSMKGLFTREE